MAGFNSEVHSMTNKPEAKMIPSEYAETYYNYDDVSFVNVGITKKCDLYSRPSTVTSQMTFNSANTPIIFEVNPMSGYLRFSEAFLLCSFTLRVKNTVDADNTITAIPSSHLTTLENDFFWKLFTDIKLDVGGMTVEYINNVSKVSSMLGKCLYSKTYKDTGGIAYGWAPDSTTIQDSPMPADNTNFGFVTRRSYFNIGTAAANGVPGSLGSLQTMAKLKTVLGFCDWDKVLYQIPITLTLTRSAVGTGVNGDGIGAAGATFGEILFGSDTAARTYYFNIQSINLMIPKYDPVDTVEGNLLDRFSIERKIPVRFLKRTCQTKTIMATFESWSLGTANSNPSSALGIPMAVLVGFKNTTTSVATNDDGFMFPRIRSLRLTLGGQYYPMDFLQTDVDIANGKSQCGRAYDMYAQFCWKMGNEPTMSISHFRNYDAIFCIDCSAHNKVDGSVAAEIKLDMDFFSIPTAPATINVYALILTDAQYEINTSNNRMTQMFNATKNRLIK